MYTERWPCEERNRLQVQERRLRGNQPIRPPSCEDTSFCGLGTRRGVWPQRLELRQLRSPVLADQEAAHAGCVSSNSSSLQWTGLIQTKTGRRRGNDPRRAEFRQLVPSRLQAGGALTEGQEAGEVVRARPPSWSGGFYSGVRGHLPTGDSGSQLPAVMYGGQSWTTKKPQC